MYKPEPSQHAPLTEEEREAIVERTRRSVVRATAIVEAAHLIFAEQNGLVHYDERDDGKMRAAKAALQRHVAELAACLRVLALPAERVVALAREMAEEAVERTGPGLALAVGPLVRELRDDIVRWVIDGYYAAPLVQQLAPRRPSVVTGA